MKITEYDEGNVYKFIGRLMAESSEGRYSKLVNMVVNTACGLMSKIKGNRSNCNKQLTATVVKTHRNDGVPAEIGRCVLFASYSSRGTVEDYVAYYLKELSKCSDYIIYIADNDFESSVKFDKISPFVDCIIYGRHGRFDFGSWEIGIQYLKENNLFNNINQLVLANDSCYGPVFSLSDVFNRMAKVPYDFWGLVDSRDVRYHIQSFFIVFNKNVVSSKLFSDFFEDLPLKMTWDMAVNYGELRLTKHLSSEFNCGAYLHDMCVNSNAIKAGNMNSTSWPVYSLKRGMPLVKVKALSEQFGPALNEGIADALGLIVDANPELHTLILQDLKRRGVPDSDLEFDKLSSDPRRLFHECDVISFDVFGTLLVRSCMDSIDIFYSIGETYDRDFPLSRIDSEKRAREKTASDDVTLHEIYLEMPDHLRHFESVELEYESRTLHLNPRIVPILSAAVESEKPIVCITDTQLSSSFLHDMLVKNGIRDIAKIYVNSEYRKNKSSGELFAQVLNDYGIHPNRLVHFGNDENSDYSIPRDMGVSAYLIDGCVDRFFRSSSNYKYSKFININNTLSASVHLALISEYRYAEDLSCSYWRDFAYCVGGPLAYSYVQFICDVAKAEKIDKLLFASDSGAILQKIYEKYFVDKYKIDSERVYLTEHVGITSLSEHYGEPTYLKALLNWYDEDIPEYKAGMSNRKSESIFERNKSRLLEISADAREGLFKHVEGASKDSKSVAIVDTTTELLPSYYFAKQILGNRVKLGMSICKFKENSDPKHYTFLKRLSTESDRPAIKLSELLISSPEAPILSMNKDGSAVRGKNVVIDSNIYSEIERGILDYCDDFNRTGLSSSSMSMEEWISLANHYVAYSNCIDVEALADVYEVPKSIRCTETEKMSDYILEVRQSVSEQIRE